MKWYRKLYLGSGLENKKDELVRKLECNAGVPGLYVITLASNKNNLFDIFSSNMLLQPVLHGLCPVIIGLTKSQEEAIRMIEEIVMATWKETGAFDVWSHLKNQVEMGEEPVEEYPMDKLKRRRRGWFGRRDKS